ncbi:hydrogenase expression protein HupH [Corynebacterium xerosis]|uniref:hydrogenase nickel incorporation protein HypB n=1 Tax=Corynebacterium TaxID=1716 RepID=UPI0006280CC1|nr:MULTISPECIES: hydrogenase nickel incorporation protein HypB [Corynebacterium]KKO82176.1 hydrogenase expression protein HupH [Corynebacterium xerosis]SQB95998.1 hydrogenase accessory protein HypB [Clostridium paraputrificum]HHT32956.1 hydrogenase nickel incorporation protein HypB [Corynebacterium sp.]
MGRFHRHDDGTVHAHDHGDHPHEHHHHHDHGHGHDHGHAHDHAHDLSHVDADSAEHGDHTGYDTGRERVLILEDIFTENDVRAAENRALFDDHGVTAINVMSSPGSGKTALLRHALEDLRGKVRVGVIEGDIETPLDAERLEGFGAQISLLNTGNGFGGECHLDAPMISSALRGLDLAELDLVFIENVGNLVCPAEFEVGEHRKMMVYAVTEGEDKPLKYPVMFRSVEAVAVNKIDLLPYLDFDMDLFLANLRTVNPDAKVFEVSAKTGEGLDAWLGWLLEGKGDR